MCTYLRSVETSIGARGPNFLGGSATNIPVTTANSPLDRQLDGHALTTTTYLGVEAIDLYITIQVNGIHTIARRMDDESKTPHVST